MRVRLWVKTEGREVGVRFYKINGRSVNTIWHQYRYLIMHSSIFIVRSTHGVFQKLRYVIYIFIYIREISKQVVIVVVSTFFLIHLILCMHVCVR